MKKVLFVLMAFCLVSSLALAAESTGTVMTTDAAATVTAATTTKTETAIPVATATTTATTQTTTPVTTTVTTQTITPVTTTVSTNVAVITPEVIVLKGDLIDNMCAGANKDKLAEFVKTHTKECTLKPACIDSGYSIFAEGKLYAFDKDSNVKVVEFLKQADSKLQVTVTAKQVGDELNLASIENQK